jgi:alpha-D-xyloside xylohydrolase
MYRYGLLTGFSPEMPEWVFGFWQSKLRYESQAELLDVARTYKEKGLPLDAIVIDYFHWTEFGDWDFDDQYWPDPAEMCKVLAQMNVHPVISVWPAINENSRNFHHMSDEGMLIATKDGEDCLLCFAGQQMYIDPTNPKTRAFQWEQVKKAYYDRGIKAYWLDASEPEINPLRFENLIYYIGDGEQVSLAYPYFNQKTFYDGVKANGEEYSVLLTRSAYAGSQKFGSIVWNGDIHSNFEALKDSVISGLSMGMCGIPWWNSDIGGFTQGDTESEYFRELIVRWFQFGLFCPVMRLHGCRKQQTGYIPKNPGIIAQSGGDNEIWSFGEENYEILQNILRLRERLKPYIGRLSREAAQKGSPIMRPMFFEFPDDPYCCGLDDQYMFGPDILFAPIYKYGETSRRVYLPEGEWIRTSDKSVHSGKTTITCTAQKNEFVAFVKKGADVLEVF